MNINIDNNFVYCILIIAILLLVLGIFIFIAFIYYTKRKFHTYIIYISKMPNNKEDIEIQEIHEKFLEDLGLKNRWIKKIIKYFLMKKNN